MATGFDAVGFDVWVADVDEAALAAVPSSWTAVCCDASNEVDMAALFERLDGLDVLCANAGIAGPTALVEDIDLSEWQRCVSVNLEGAFWPANTLPP